MKPIFFLLMLLGSIHYALGFAFDTTQYFYFQSDQSELTNETKAQLKNWLPWLKNQPEVLIKLIGHTDSDADVEYNNQLSLNRSKAIKKWLTNNGLPYSSVKTYWKSEIEPLNQNLNAQEKQRNRRVEMRVLYNRFENLAEVKSYLKTKSTQSFTVQSTRDTTLITKSGTSLSIPASAFNVDEGTEVIVEVCEGRNAYDAFVHNLQTMTTSGTMMESGGMFEIKALANNKAIEIATGKSISVDMNPASKIASPQLFAAVQEGRQVLWSDNSSPIEQPQPEIPPLKEKISIEKLNLPAVSEPNFMGSYRLTARINYPVRPNTPREPKMPMVMELNESKLLRKKVTKHYTDLSLEANLSNKKYRKMKRSLDIRQDKYLDRLHRYQVRLDKYPADSARFSHAFDSIQHSLNQYLTKFQNKINEYVEYHVLSVIEPSYRVTVNQLNKGNLTKYYKKYLRDVMKQMPVVVNGRKYRMEQLNERFVLDIKSNNENVERSKRNMYEHFFNTSAEKYLNAHLKDEIQEIQNTLNQHYLENGLMNEREALNYAFDINATGWWNVDRLIANYGDDLVEVEIEAEKGTEVQIIFDERLIKLPLTRKQDAYIAQVPYGVEVQVVAVKLIDGGLSYAKTVRSFKDGYTELNLSFEPTSFDNLAVVMNE